VISMATTTRMVACALVLACVMALNLPVWAKGQKNRGNQHIPVTFVKGIPVARFNTDIGPMWMVLDSGSTSTYFSEQIIRSRNRICFQGSGCKITAGVTNYVPQFARFLRGKHDRSLVIDGLVGEDVLSKFKEVRLDYHKQEVVLVTKGGQGVGTLREEHEIEIRKEQMRRWRGN
jgi:hypothetical protein